MHVYYLKTHHYRLLLHPFVFISHELTDLGQNSNSVVLKKKMFVTVATALPPPPSESLFCDPLRKLVVIKATNDVLSTL
jgi:hypothetical protein